MQHWWPCLLQVSLWPVTPAEWALQVNVYTAPLRPVVTLSPTATGENWPSTTVISWPCRAEAAWPHLSATKRKQEPSLPPDIQSPGPAAALTAAMDPCPFSSLSLLLWVLPLWPFGAPGAFKRNKNDPNHGWVFSLYTFIKEYLSSPNLANLEHTPILWYTHCCNLYGCKFRVWGNTNTV